MKQLLVAVALAAAILVGGNIASSAPSAPPTTKRVATLEKQVKTLRAQVKTLQTQVRNVSGNVAAFELCQAAVVGDALQATWSVVNQVAGRAAVATSPSVDDRRACEALRVTRQASGSAPTTAGLAALNAVLTGGRSGIPLTLMEPR